MSGQERIETLIRKAQGRIRLQYVLDGGTLGLAAGLFAAAVVVALLKSGVIASTDQWLWLGACALLPLGAVVWGFVRRINPVAVAAAIDRSNGFKDRLSSAYEFLQSEKQTEFQKVQIKDTLARIGDVDPSRAHAMRRPPDVIAVGIGALALLIVYLVQFPHPPQDRPIGVAGPDQTVMEETPVRLDGTLSTSGSGEGLSYKWRQVEGPAVELSSNASPSPMFTAPVVDEFPHILVFELVVNDQLMDSSPDRITVVVEDTPPVVTNLPADIRVFREDQVEELIKKAEEAGDEEAKEAAEELRDLLEEDKMGKITPQEFNEKLASIADSMKSNCETVDYGALQAALKPLSPKFSDAEFLKPVKDNVDAGKFEEATVALDELAVAIWNEEAFAKGLSRDDFFAQLDNIQEVHLLCEKKEIAKAEKQIQEAAKELEKQEETKDIAKSLKDGDYEKAAKQIEELAKKIELGDIDPKTAEKLASLLEKFADKLDFNDPELAKKFEKYKNLVKKLKKKQASKKGLSKSEKRKLDDAKKNLERLQREKEKNDRGAGRRIKRLQRQTKAAADELRKKQQGEEKEGDKGEKRAGDKGEKQDGKNPDGQQGEKQGDKQGDQKGGDQKGSKLDKKDGDKEGDGQGQATDELRKLDRDKKGQEARDDVKETSEKMEEDAKRSEGGQSGKKNDDRASKIDDYLNRRGGGDEPKEGQGGGKDGKEGKGQAKGGGQGKDGQGKDGGKSGQGKDGGQGEGAQESNQHGKGSGGDPEGGRTQDMGGERENTEVKGQKGAGPSKAETIKEASQQGFSSRRYKEVYDEYESAVEDVLEQEKVPPGYKHYVRRYFDAIRPEEE